MSIISNVSIKRRLQKVKLLLLLPATLAPRPPQLLKKIKVLTNELDNKEFEALISTKNSPDKLAG
ncbi:hypothetical protein RO3G_09702 [Rhizopus delemar RA 99-880]|uniref:Uncharacterized protein n=1 Tax=Rhizopus delemar (strain RA 99-880 / ATCC MYA-4621 / FGSC 9543 / NRRL 43880) TaxID=246409 RepID=I1C962_RHIO9|nr:hypothetical protein RO3G_09702 [Rhizopus delemar RA 99-880]|eukprot:EIE84992.1 hypothetical protein RO3G_09702 [Rhizopus delemar RA 99-880]